VIEIGRDSGHNPFELGRGALIERRKPDKGALSVAHVSTSCGASRASIYNSSDSGTISMTTSPGVITPPMVCTDS